MRKGQTMSAEDRARLSEAMRASPHVQAARRAQIGRKRGPASDETRARMSASKKARPGTLLWQTLYFYYFDKLRAERNLAALVATTTSEPSFLSEPPLS